MTPEGIEYRTATKEDLDDIIALWEESQEYHSQLDPRLNMRPNAGEHVRKFYDEKFFNDNAIIFLAVLKKRVIGFTSAFLQARPPIHFEPYWGFVDALVITSEYRRTGIGTSLLHHVKEWLREKGIVTMRLSVATQNPNGISFWKKMGFSEIMYLMDLKLDEDE